MVVAESLRTRLRPRCASFLGRAAALAAVLLATAEGTARLADWLRDGTPLTAVPDNDRDLTLFDGQSVRGRPWGRYQHWRLNAYGFRGPDEMTPNPDGRARVMTLGGSETLGLYESDGREYAAQVRDSLRSDGIEVVNAGIANLALRGTISFWTAWAARFRPAVVTIYAAPTFYLGDDIPDWRRRGPPSPEASGASPAPRFAFRLLGRVQEQTRGLTWFNHWRHARTLRRLTAGHPPDWFFPPVPADRIRAYVADLDSLVTAVRAAGAVPVLITPASAFTFPLEWDDAAKFSAALLRTPRARPDVFVTFVAAADDSVRALAARRGLQVVDVARDLSGRRDLFASAVHYNDAGATAVAARIVPAVRAAVRTAARTADNHAPVGYSATVPRAAAR